MSKLPLELMRYKHYLIVIAALLVATYIITPLSEWQASQQQKYNLLVKKNDKVKNLLENKEEFSNALAEAKDRAALVSEYVYIDDEEANFKLIAQSKIEKILKESDCNVDRIGFKGSTIVDENLSKWRLEVRFNGDAVCIVQTVRVLESAKPIFNIDNYNMNHRGFDENAAGSFVAIMNLDAWHLKGRN